MFLTETNDLRKVLMLGNTRFILGGCCLRVTSKKPGDSARHGQSLGQRTLVSPIWIDCGALTLNKSPAQRPQRVNCGFSSWYLFILGVFIYLNEL